MPLPNTASPLLLAAFRSALLTTTLNADDNDDDDNDPVLVSSSKQMKRVCPFLLRAGIGTRPSRAQEQGEGGGGEPSQVVLLGKRPT